MMRSLPRRGVFLLWLLTAALLGAGAFAARAQEATKASDSAAVAPRPDTPQAAPTAAEAVAQARAEVATPWYSRLMSGVGLLALLGIAWSLSMDRRSIPWRVVLWGTGLQFAFALFILRTPLGERIFATLNTMIVALLGFTVEGARFIFGNLVWNNVPIGSGEALGNAPIAETPGLVAQTGGFFAFNVLPTIIFFSSLMTVLYPPGGMQWIGRGMGWVIKRDKRTAGAETPSAGGNILPGQAEAPPLVKPFRGNMTPPQLMAVMVGGFAT